MENTFNFPRINERAPEFEARTTHGVRKLDDYQGKWLVLFRMQLPRKHASMKATSAPTGTSVSKNWQSDAKKTDRDVHSVATAEHMSGQ
jgi:hypothetical protein